LLALSKMEWYVTSGTPVAECIHAVSTQHGCILRRTLLLRVQSYRLNTSILRDHGVSSSTDSVFPSTQTRPFQESSATFTITGPHYDYKMDQSSITVSISLLATGLYFD
jgi:hypothetical protein